MTQPCTSCKVFPSNIVHDYVYQLDKFLNQIIDNLKDYTQNIFRISIYDTLDVTIVELMNDLKKARS